MLHMHTVMVEAEIMAIVNIIHKDVEDKEESDVAHKKLAKKFLKS